MRRMLPKTSPFVLVFLLSVSFSAVSGQVPEWRPVTQAELDMTNPLVDPEADAEAIFWDVKLDDESSKKLYYEHYVRIKIFTERGRETYSKIDIRFFEGTKLENVAGRVIKPDGTIIDVAPSEIFERDIATARRFKLKAKSFVVPGIEPGVIVEYQYRERFKGENLSGERLSFQKELPVQKVTYRIRPYKDRHISRTFFNTPELDFEPDPAEEGFLKVSMKNVPAFKEEPYMPPDDTVKPWAILRYSGSSFGWAGMGSRWGDAFEYFSKPDKAISKKADELARGTSTVDERIRKAFDFVRSEIQNVTYDDSTVTRKQLKFKKPSEILKRRFGTTYQVNILFASLLRAMKISPSQVFTPDRSDFFFNPSSTPPFASFLHYAGISVLVDGKRKFYNPGRPYLPFGMLGWHEEYVHALIANGTGNRWITIKMAAPGDSVLRRTGKFELDNEGNLIGTVEKEYTGYLGIERRRSGYADSNEKRAEDLKDQVKKAFGTADVDFVSVSNDKDPELPYRQTYKLTIPNYAQKTGSRMFFMPGVFESESKPVFSSASRLHAMYFRYPWSELDEIHIRLPKDFAVENPSAPKDVKESSNIAGIEYNLTYDTESHSLVYRRSFFFGADSKVYFPVNSYKAMKKLFDSIHDSDTHSIALKRKAQ